MKIQLKPGKYVVAVSGGVDSVVLLDLLSKQVGLSLVVAHFDHGIRADSKEDAKFAQNLATKYKLPFEVGHGQLGKNASEDKARRARYGFLESTQQKHSADKIIAAHHQDDLLETVILNILRGSGWRGVVSIRQNSKILRPLLDKPKSEILKYAKLNKLSWREDKTNQSKRYLRNQIRLSLIPQLSQPQRQKLLDLSDNLNSHVNAIQDDSKKVYAAAIKKGALDRRFFAMIPAAVGNELVRYWLEQNKIKDIDKSVIYRLSAAIKTAKPGQRFNVLKNWWLEIAPTSARLSKVRGRTPLL